MKKITDTENNIDAVKSLMDPNIKKKLNFRQQAFVRNYVNGMSKSDAAREAHFHAKFARNSGDRLTKIPHIKDAIEQYASAAAAEADLRTIDVLKELKAWMTHNNRFDDPRIGALSLKATELIGKHLRMWTDKLEVNVVSHEQALIEMRQIYENAVKDGKILEEDA